MDPDGATAPAAPSAPALAVGEAVALPLATEVLDRVGERRGDEAWLAARWADPRTRVLHVLDGRAETAGDPPALVAVAPYDTDATRLLLGVNADDVAWFAVVGERPGRARDDDGSGPQWRGLRELGLGLGARDAALLVQALGLANWHQRHPHCPGCGAPTVVVEAGYVRRCTVEGTDHHPRTDPAVIMLVTDDADRALLGRHARWDRPVYSTLAGFVEPGESAESAVAREVREEASVTVRDVTFLGSQPWPFPSSLMLGFRARSDGGDPVPDGTEIADVRWFARDELAAAVAAGEVLLPPGLSIARRLIEGWFGGALSSRAAP